MKSMANTSCYPEWSDRFYRANTALHDRDARVQECFAQLEQNLTLLGATAIEDRLQAYVPETIKLLRTAGMLKR